MNVLSSLLVLCFVFMTLGHARVCVNLKPYEAILNAVIDAIPGREIQDSLPLPLSVKNGEEVWRKRIENWFCDLDIMLDSVVIQVANINFEKINVEVFDREAMTFTISVSANAATRVHADCGIYRPKIMNQIRFGYTFTARADVCIDIKGIADLPNILNYTYATVSNLEHTSDIETFDWCIYDALPLLKSIIDDLLNENVDEIWKAINSLLEEQVLPGVEVAINSALRAIGIEPYNSTLPENTFYLPPMKKPEPVKIKNLIEVVQTTNFSSLLYNDKGSGAWMDVSFYRPTTVHSGFYPLGDYVQGNYDSPKGNVMMVKDDGGIYVAKPTGYNRIWTDKGSRADMDGSVWQPIPPEGFVALGHVCQGNYDQPSTDVVRVIKSECVVRCDPWMTWTDRCSGADDDVSIWEIAETTSPIPGTFISNSNYDRPDKSLLLCLNPDCIKQVDQ